MFRAAVSSDASDADDHHRDGANAWQQTKNTTTQKMLGKQSEL